MARGCAPNKHAFNQSRLSQREGKLHGIAKKKKLYYFEQLTQRGSSVFDVITIIFISVISYSMTEKILLGSKITR